MNKKEVFDLLNRIAEGIALTFGSSCETLIHDMSVKGQPLLAIYNGHVTGREKGSTVNILGSTSDLEDFVAGVDFVNHLAVTPSGRQIKSSTFQVNGEDYKYALGINFDITDVMSANRILLDFMNVGVDLRGAISQAGEGKLSEIFLECVEIIGKNVSDMNKKDRLQLVKLLKQRDVFTFQKSVPFVSEMLNVSRYTVYNYLHELESEMKGEKE